MNYELKTIVRATEKARIKIVYSQEISFNMGISILKELIIL